VADLNEILRQLEEAEARLRPLVREAREAIQDLKQAEKDFRAAVKKELEGDAGELIRQELKLLLPAVRKERTRVVRETGERAAQVLEVIDRLEARYIKIGERYDEVERQLQAGGFTGEIQLPVPASRARQALGKKRPRGQEEG